MITRLVSRVIGAGRTHQLVSCSEQWLRPRQHRRGGRDIRNRGVWLDAPVKIFLTASAETRARRRNAQNVAAGLADDMTGYWPCAPGATTSVHPGGVTAQAAGDAVIVDTSDDRARWSCICWSWSRGEVRRCGDPGRHVGGRKRLATRRFGDRESGGTCMVAVVGRPNVSTVHPSQPDPGPPRAWCKYSGVTRDQVCSTRCGPDAGSSYRTQ